MATHLHSFDEIAVMSRCTLLDDFDSVDVPKLELAVGEVAESASYSRSWYLAAEEAVLPSKRTSVLELRRHVVESSFWCNDAAAAVLAGQEPNSVLVQRSTTSCQGMFGTSPVLGTTPTVAQHSVYPHHSSSSLAGAAHANSFAHGATIGNCEQSQAPLLGTMPVAVANCHSKADRAEEIFRTILAQLEGSPLKTTICLETSVGNDPVSPEKNLHLEDESNSNCSTALGSPRSCPSSSADVSPPSESRQHSNTRNHDEPFAPGTVVLVDGLVESPAFNGLAGTVHSVDAENGRYNVVLASQSLPGGKQMFRLRPGNMQVAVPSLSTIRVC
jgi:hypothetical protein